MESKGKNRVKKKERTLACRLDSYHKLITSFFSLRKGIHEKLRDNNFYAHFKFSPRGIITLNFPFRKTRQKHAIEHAPNPIHSERYLLFVSPSTVGSDTLLEKSYRSVPTRIARLGNWININRVTDFSARFSPLRSVESIADVHQSRFPTRFTTVLLHTGSDIYTEHLEIVQRFSTGFRDQIKRNDRLITSGGN